MHQDYRSPVLRQLRDQQVRFAPADKKVAQARRAERLLSEIVPEREYPYEFLCHRITDFRPDAAPGAVATVTGDDVKHDLRLFVEDVSSAADLPADSVGEDVLTVDELSKQFNVSTKTIARWRDQGLVSWRLVFDGRKRVGFLKSSVDRFVESNPERIERGAKFSQLNDEEREQIISLARRSAADGACPAVVAREVAERMGRSVETIRYTLKQFDEEHPDMAIFPFKTGPLSENDREAICDDFKRGESVDALAERYGRTKTSIYRIVSEVRAKRISELPLDLIDNDDFRNPALVDAILAPMPGADEPPKKSRLPAGLPPYLASLYEIPLLNREQEAHLFRKMNFLKARAKSNRERLDPARPKSSLMDQIERD
ncbi:MAG TPA: RNA polymerase subunit sigma-70, partial [Pirellulales bacterium]